MARYIALIFICIAISVSGCGNNETPVEIGSAKSDEKISEKPETAKPEPQPEDKANKYRSARVRAIEPIDKSKKLGEWIEQLSSKDLSERKDAVYELGELKSIKAVKPLILVINDEEIRDAVCNALVKIGNTAIPELIKAFTDGDVKSRAVIARILGKLKAKSAVPVLIQALSELYYIAEPAAKALGEIGDKSAVPALLKNVVKDGCLNDEACMAIVKMGRESIPMIIGFAHDQTLGAYVADIIHSISHPGIAELIMNLDSDDERIRRDSAFLLYKISYLDPVPKYPGYRGMSDPVHCVKLAKRMLTIKRFGEAGPSNRIYYIDDVPALIKALLGKDAEVRRYIIHVLGAGNESAAIPLIIRATQDEDIEVRKSAVSVLGLFHSRDAVPYIIKALQDKDDELRAYAAIALGDIGDKSAEAALITALSDKNRVVRTNSAYALGEIKSRLAVPELIKALKDTEQRMRISSVIALGKIGDRAAVLPLCALVNDEDNWFVSEIRAALKQMPDKAAIPTLIKMLDDDDSWVADDALDMLGDIGDKSVLPVLLKYMKNKQDKLEELGQAEKAREWLKNNEHLIIAIGKCGDKSVFPLLADLFQNTYEHQAAAEGMETIDMQAARAEYIRLSKQETGHIHDLALKRLCLSADKTMVPLLIEIYQDKDESVRYEAIKQLFKFGDKSVAPVFVKALEDKYADIRYMAVEFVGKYSCVEAVPSLIKMLDRNGYYYVGKNAGNALVKIGKPAIPAIINAMKKSDDREFLSSAIWFLGKIKDSSAVPFIITMLDNKNTEQYACFALGDIKDKAAVPALVKVFKSDRYYWVRILAAEALAEIGARSVIPMFIESLKADCVSYGHIIKILGQFKAKEAIPELLGFLSSKGLAKEAAVALEDIGDRSIIPELIKVSSGDRANCRIWAHYLLAVFDRDREFNAQVILKILQMENDADVKGYAIEALGKLRYKPAIPFLEEYIRNGHEFSAMNALIQIDDPRCVEIITRAVYEGFGGCGVAGSMGRSGNKAYIPALIHLLRRGWAHCLGDHAGQALTQLIGQDLKQNIHQWREWWEANKERVLKEEAEKEKAKGE